LDVGCGTGSLVVKIKSLSPETDIHGIDPDKEILLRAKAKAKKNSVKISFHQGCLSPESRSELGYFSKVASSLVLHQTPIEEKRNILVSIFRLLLPGGKLCVADYGLQRTALMKTLFRRTVQTIDGVKDTQPNAEGCIPNLMQDVGFLEVSETQVIPTLTGSISIYTAKSVV
uniref:class I SAM-dependent methyltransferase n=1 Tax=Desulfosarcina sp. TaxID=2027861 RepID=UPI0035660145